MDTGCPEQCGGQEKDGERGQGCIWKTVAEESEQGDVSEEDRKGKEQGVDGHVIKAERVQGHVDPYDAVVGDMDPGIVVVQIKGVIVDQPVAGYKAPLVEIPDITMFGIIPVGYYIVQQACQNVQAKEEQEIYWSDAAVPDEWNF